MHTPNAISTRTWPIHLSKYPSCDHIAQGSRTSWLETPWYKQGVQSKQKGLSKVPLADYKGGLGLRSDDTASLLEALGSGFASAEHGLWSLDSGAVIHDSVGSNR